MIGKGNQFFVSRSSHSIYDHSCSVMVYRLYIRVEYSQYTKHIKQGRRKAEIEIFYDKRVLSFLNYINYVVTYF